MKHQIFQLICIVLLNYLLVACAEPPPITPPIELLAHKASFSISGRVFHLPLIAVSSGFRTHVEIPCKQGKQWKCGMSLETIANTHEPITLDSLEIELENYSSFYDTRIDGTIPMPELCHLLSQQWAQKICQKDRIIDYRLYLRRFTIVKADDIGTISYIDGSTESTGQMVKRMSLDEAPSLFCAVDKQGKPLSLCPVAMKVSDNLLAVWIVSTRNSESATIAKQAQVIRALLQFAFGESEDTQALYTALQ